MNELDLAFRMIGEHIAWQVKTGIRPLEAVRKEVFRAVDDAFLDYVSEQGLSPQSRADFLNMDIKKFGTLEIKLSQNKGRSSGLFKNKKQDR
jgi:hypothetical protein